MDRRYIQSRSVEPICYPASQMTSIRPRQFLSSTPVNHYNHDAMFDDRISVIERSYYNGGQTFNGRPYESRSCIPHLLYNDNMSSSYHRDDPFRSSYNCKSFSHHHNHNSFLRDEERSQTHPIPKMMRVVEEDRICSTSDESRDGSPDELSDTYPYLGGNQFSPSSNNNFMNNQNSSQIDGNEQPLYLWIIKKLPDTTGVCVEGKRSLDDDSFWHSTLISQRINSHLVKSCSGSFYKLMGDMEIEDALTGGFDEETVRHFYKGFPVNWQNYIDRFFSKLREGTLSTPSEPSDGVNLLDDTLSESQSLDDDTLTKSMEKESMEKSNKQTKTKKLQSEVKKVKTQKSDSKTRKTKQNKENEKKYTDAFTNEKDCEGQWNSTLKSKTPLQTAKMNTRSQVNKHRTPSDVINSELHLDKNRKPRTSSHVKKMNSEPCKKTYRHSDSAHLSKLRTRLSELNTSEEFHQFKQKGKHTSEELHKFKQKGKQDKMSITREKGEKKTGSRNDSRNARERNDNNKFPLSASMTEMKLLEVSTPEGKIMTLDAIQKTRSGRAVKPVLAWWAGQSVSVDHKNNSYILNHLTSHAESVFREMTEFCKTRSYKNNRKVNMSSSPLKPSSHQVKPSPQQVKTSSKQVKQSQQLKSSKQVRPSPPQVKPSQQVKSSKQVRPSPPQVKSSQQLSKSSPQQNLLKKSSKKSPDQSKKKSRTKASRQKRKSQDKESERVELTARRGTLKRKQQLRDIIDQSNKNYKEDLFDGTPYRHHAKIPRLERDEEEEDVFAELTKKNPQMMNKIFTPMTRITVAPISTRKTPASQLVSPGVSIDRKDADQYMRKMHINRRKLVSQSKTKKTLTAKKKDTNILQAPTKKLFSKTDDLQNITFMEKCDSDSNHDDSEDEADYYFSE